MPHLHPDGDDRADSDWLTSGALHVIVYYCQPRDRVLLLADTGAEPCLAACGLSAVAESVSGLVRTIAVRTLHPVDQLEPPGKGEDAAAESGSGPELPISPRQSVPYRTPQDRPEPSNEALILFDTVIACVDAHSAGRVDDIPWNALLGPAGLLVFITHSDALDGCSATLRCRLAAAARRAGLLPLEELALPHAPAQKQTVVSLFIRPLPAVSTTEQEPC
ncbi:hypothetical protein [Streptomyces longispororuber]|uniref:hypothetical protein n=1 Tax=Streptomyces longispororuber TaxID=68230 RepID=UPI0036FCB48E